MIEEKSPSEKLAALTADQLIAAGLLRADKRDLVIAKIASGKMNAEEWKLQIELGVEKAGEA
jgi:hypothetical protein